MKKILWTLLIALAVVSCGKKGRFLPTVTGSANEVLVVINEQDWKSPAGKALYDVLTTPVVGLPQDEPTLDISRVQFQHFDNLLNATRNIIFVQISPNEFTKPTIKYSRERWARTQAIITITAPDDASLEPFIREHKDKILDFFVKAERERQVALLKSNSNKAAYEMIYKNFGIKLLIPSNLNKYKHGDNFFWATNGSAITRQDIIVYSYPYTDKNTFTEAYLLAKRDSVMKVNMPGSFEGSHMGTEYRVSPPVMTPVWVNDAYCAEIRGLWKMIDGESMGGPFVSHTRLDELTNRVVTVEAFVFAPSKTKRNATRQVEAALYTLKLAHEQNEVQVVAKKK